MLWSEKKRSAPLVTSTPDFAKLAEKLVPAVVYIEVTQKPKRRAMRSSPAPRGQDPFEFFHRFFGEQMPRDYQNKGLGTGFVIQKDGLILTNYHVIENADQIEIIFATADGSEKKMLAKVLGSAPEYDVALLKTEKKANASIAYLGNSDKVKIGEWVMAIGNPFGLSHSVSVGIISAKERREVMPSGRRGLYDFMQTDASINPGNSGGPLVNTKGEVIGINTAINASGSGIGFAIPINMVKAMLPDLKSKGKFSRSWIGIRIQPLTKELAQSYGLKKTEGALVAEVVPNSPAKKAGILEGDIVLEFDGKPVRNSSDLPLYASMAGVGHNAKIKIWRNKKKITAEVTLTGFPEESSEKAELSDEEGVELGLTISDITPELQKEFSLKTEQGALVKAVDPGSAAARSGLRAGDVVLRINAKSIQKARDFAKIAKKAKAGTVLRLQVLRQGSRMFLALRKPSK
tara:strand:+ start:2716 stop:4095 length:1380 start_codon:yes stop_codon:yes gene_type:complete